MLPSHCDVVFNSGLSKVCPHLFEHVGPCMLIVSSYPQMSMLPSHHDVVYSCGYLPFANK